MIVVAVTIEPGNDPGVFRVALTSPAGEATENVALDVDHIRACFDDVQDALRNSAIQRRRLMPRHEQPVREVGEELFKALLGTRLVADRYVASRSMAETRQEGLRLVLRIDDPTLAGLPWEAMYDAAQQCYVCQEEPLVRHVPVARVAPPLTVPPPLRVLGIAASPRGLPELDVEKEQEQLTRALAGPLAAGRIALEWAPRATWADLQDLLLDESKTWHVIHFIGHGDFDVDNDTGVLALVNERGRSHLVEASQFVNLLRLAKPMPRLVVLNSCSGAATGELDLFASTAAALVRSGVTAVAAMQFEISDVAAIAFTRGFYTAIANNRGIDEAAGSGRTAIIGLSASTLEWITPVLYLRGGQSQLFTFPQTTASPRQEVTGPSTALTGNARTPPPTSGPAAPVPTQPTATESRATPPRTASGPRTTASASPPSAATPKSRDRAAPHHPGTTPMNTFVILKGHERSWRGSEGGAVAGVAFSADGSMLATGGADATVRIWNPATGENRSTLTGHTRPVIGVAFGPDKMLASGGLDKTIRLWNPETCDLIGTIIGDTGPIAGVALSVDGTLAAAGVERVAYVWGRTAGEKVRMLTGHAGKVNAVAFSPDGSLLATTSSDHTVQVWSPSAGSHIGTLRGHTGTVNGVAFSPDGRLLATGGLDNTTRLWDARTGTHLGTLAGHSGPVRGVAFSPDGETLATAGWDHTIRLWDTRRRQCIRTLSGHAGPVNGVAFSPDGRMLASTSDDRTARLWL